jgi:hypothetical protein
MEALDNFLSTLWERKNGVTLFSLGVWGLTRVRCDLTTLLSAVFIMSLERLAYGVVYHATPKFKSLAKSLGQDPLEFMHLTVFSFKLVQASMIVKLLSAHISSFDVGAMLVAVGQFLNLMVYYRLGAYGVHYGAQLGTEPVRASLSQSSQPPFLSLSRPPFFPTTTEALLLLGACQ